MSGRARRVLGAGKDQTILPDRHDRRDDSDLEPLVHQPRALFDVGFEEGSITIGLHLNPIPTGQTGFRQQFAERATARPVVQRVDLFFCQFADEAF